MSDQTVLILNRVLPILLLLGLGLWVRWRDILPSTTVDDLRKMVVQFALPAVLFTSFLNIEMQASFLVLFAMVFVVCLLLLGAGFAVKRVLYPSHPYAPYLMTGFEYGMLGVSLFAGAYGLENFSYIAVIALGHELFIWFVFLAFLLVVRDGAQSPAQLGRSFLSSPVIVAVLAGIILNLLGLGDVLPRAPITGGIIGALTFLSNMTVPLILLIVGYGIRFDTGKLREALPVIGLRLGLLIPLALVINRIVIRGWLELPVGFEAALFILLILPPPFIIPLYMKSGMPDEEAFVNNILTLHTLASLIVFAIFFIQMPIL